jgi:hypothetical protein
MMKPGIQLATYTDRHVSTSQVEMSCTAAPSIEGLGRQIVALVEAGDKAERQSIEKFTSAGIMLIEAKSRVPNFPAFLRDHRNGLNRSRAYELIDMALGKWDEVRAKANERKRRYSARVRSGTDTRTGSALPTLASAALAAFKTAAGFQKWTRSHGKRRWPLQCVAPHPAPETGQSPYGLLKLQRPSEMPIEDA